jgi:hypothetical protein
VVSGARESDIGTDTDIDTGAGAEAEAEAEAGRRTWRMRYTGSHATGSSKNHGWSKAWGTQAARDVTTATTTQLNDDIGTETVGGREETRW